MAVTMEQIDLIIKTLDDVVWALLLLAFIHLIHLIIRD